jgi:hypothetical protein
MTQRLRVLHLISHPPSGVDYIPGRPVRPKVWEDDWTSASPGSSGIRHLELRWEATATQGRPFTRRRPRDGETLATSSSHASWMDPSPARLPPLLRAIANRSAAVDTPARAPRRRQQPSVPLDDSVDVACPAPTVPPWASVYRVIADRRLPRHHRATAWRLLHGFLPCGAFLLHVQRTADADATSTCPHPACLGASATLTHIFVTCPLARTVVGWLSDVWATIEPGNRPPATFAVFAVGDLREWMPRTPDLWVRLRLRALHELWCAARSSPQPSANGVASRIILGAAADMRLDWLRASLPAHILADACGSWMTGGGRSLSPEAGRDQFAQLWCVNGTLCQLPAVGAASPLVRWSATWPVPLPPTPVHPAGTALVS